MVTTADRAREDYQSLVKFDKCLCCVQCDAIYGYNICDNFYFSGKYIIQSEIVLRE